MHWIFDVSYKLLGLQPCSYGKSPDTKDSSVFSWESINLYKNPLIAGKCLKNQNII